MRRAYSGLTIVVALNSVLAAQGQIASLSLESPRWGEKLGIIYNPEANDAAFRITDEVYVFAFVYAGDAANTHAWKMQRRGNALVYDFTVEKNTGYLTFHFITRGGWDRRASVSTMVYREDGEAALGAWERSMFSAGASGYLEAFGKEIARYPNNYAAYRTKWFVTGALNKDALEDMVRKDIETIAKQPSADAPSYLFAMTHGRMVLGDEPDARKAVLAVLERHPESHAAYRAVSDYRYQVFSRQISGDGPAAVDKAVLAAVAKAPASPLARDEVRRLAPMTTTPLATIEAISRQWMRDEPDHPFPHYCMAQALYARRLRLEEAAEAARTAAELLLQGKLRFHQDVSGSVTAMFLPTSYLLWAKASLELERYADALAAVRAAHALRHETDPSAKELEGRIWDALGNEERATEAFVAAVADGSKNARGSLKELYLRRNDSEAGFDAHYAELTRITPTSTDKKKPAAKFRKTGLDGKVYDLSELRGKVVVLNFWFIGCAPCRVEMPGLNKLAAEFADKDVLFIGFATDGAEPLRKFLAEKRFDYKVIPESGGVAADYGVGSYPTHVIIDQQGRVAARLVGGSVDRHDDLRPLIQRLLDRSE